MLFLLPAKTCYNMLSSFLPKRVKTRQVFPRQNMLQHVKFFPPKHVETQRFLETVKQEQQQQQQQSHSQDCSTSLLVVKNFFQ